MYMKLRGTLLQFLAVRERPSPLMRTSPRPASLVAEVDTADVPPSADEGTSCKGCIERIDGGVLTGWVSMQDGQPLNREVKVRIDEGATFEIGELSYREDLEAAGIAQGRAAFRVDVSSALDDAPDSLDVSLVEVEAFGSVTFCRREMEPLDPRPLNPNPMMLTRGHDGIEGWKIKCNYRVGLRTDRFPLAEKLQRYADRYTRLAVLDRNAGPSPVSLRCPLRLSRSPRGELTVAVLLRADRTTEVVCRLLANDRLVAEFALHVESDWRYHRRKLSGSTDLDVKPGVQYSLELDCRHAGRGFIDIATLYVAEEPMTAYLDRVYRGGGAGSEGDGAKKERSDVPLIKNGSFSAWSQGISFGHVSPGIELSDGWFFECRRQESNSVRISMDTAPRLREGDTSTAPPSFGLRVRTESFSGPMRVFTKLDPSALNQEGLDFGIGLHALGPGGVSQIRRVFLLARGVEREAVARVLMRRERVRGKTSLSASVDEQGMAEIRRTCKDMHALLIVLEFEENSDILVDMVEVTAGTSKALPTITTDDSEGEAIEFEDTAIQAQLHLVKGLESWQEGSDSTDAMIVAKSKSVEQAVIGSPSVRAATAYPPFAGYPSVDIVVPIYNALASVRDCLTSIVQNTNVPYTVVCVDDGSDEETKRYLADFDASFPNVVLLTNKENNGYTRTVNAGLKFSNADYICVLNSDCIVTPNWLPQLIDCASKQPDVGMVGPLSNAASYQSVPQIRNECGDWSFNPLPSSVSPADMAAYVHEHSLSAWPSVRVINGFCQLIKREALEAVGVLDEKSFPRGFGEENDFCARMIAAGYRICVADDTYVFHSKSKSFGHQQRKELSKEGRVALQSKHPDIDWREVTNELEFDPALVQLRCRLQSHGMHAFSGKSSGEV